MLLIIIQKSLFIIMYVKSIYIENDSNFFWKINLTQFQCHCASPIDICEHEWGIT